MQRKFMNQNSPRVSSRALNPLSHHDDPSKTFCDKTQAKATTATQLFRDHEMLTILQKKIVPVYMERRIRKGLDVWSAGCSSGEEAYSLAILGLEELAKHKEPARLTVFATDISEEQLSKGKRGQYLYSTAGAGNVNRYMTQLKKYATVEGNVIQMQAKVRSHIKFGKFDLRCKPRKHTFDYIVCNHVFQYYDDDAQTHFARNFIQVLNPGGLIFIEGLTSRAQMNAGLVKEPGFRNVYRPEGQETK